LTCQTCSLPLELPVEADSDIEEEEEEKESSESGKEKSSAAQELFFGPDSLPYCHKHFKEKKKG
jgi:hypothetical protein